MPRPKTKRAMTRQTKLGENAEASAPTIMMAATRAYTLLRPRTSAILPNTKAPMTAPRRAEPVTQLASVVLRCHWVVTMAATVPMTNRSYASVKKPIPEMRTARR